MWSQRARDEMSPKWKDVRPCVHDHHINIRGERQGLNLQFANTRRLIAESFAVVEISETSLAFLSRPGLEGPPILWLVLQPPTLPQSRMKSRKSHDGKIVAKV